jgi:hypothetical protein
MSITETRSPWSLDRSDPHAQRGVSPGSRSSPSNPSRADGAHIAGHVGKAASSPVSLKRRDNAPIVGEPQQVIPDRR